MTIEIRQADENDAETIYRFILELATYEREPQAVITSPRVLREQLKSQNPPFECLIAEEDGSPVGFALFFQNYSTWRGQPGIYIEDIYVPPESRGRSIGKRLFREVGRIAGERNCGRMEWNVLDWNESAIAFYRGLGAAPLSGWTMYRLDGDALTKLSEKTATSR